MKPSSSYFQSDFKQRNNQMKILNDDEQTDFMKEVEEMIRFKYEQKESDDIVAT